MLDARARRATIGELWGGGIGDDACSAPWVSEPSCARSPAERCEKTVSWFCCSIVGADEAGISCEDGGIRCIWVFLWESVILPEQGVSACLTGEDVRQGGGGLDRWNACGDGRTKTGSDFGSFAGDVSTCVASKICDNEKSAAAVAPIALRITDPGVFVADVRGSMTRSPLARLFLPDETGVRGISIADLLASSVLRGVTSSSLDARSWWWSAGWVSLAICWATSQKDIDLLESFESLSLGQTVMGEDRTREGGGRSRRGGGLKRTAG
jgi:hypothetical protein